MRAIDVSTEVYAAIWAQRSEGEESEDAVLRRLLLGKSQPQPVAGTPQPRHAGGVLDSRNGVQFHEGFIAFRNYKGREYRATARSGRWVREDNGQSFPTLNQVNASIAAGAENIWNGNWKFRAPDGTVKSITALRK